MEPVSFIILIGFVAVGLASYLQAKASMREGVKRAEGRNAIIRNILALRFVLAREEADRAERAVCKARERLQGKPEVKPPQ